MEIAVQKSKKSKVVAEIKLRFEKSEAIFVVNQNRMTVVETEKLRKQLREVSSYYLVTKNTLTRLSVKDTAFECLLSNFNGQSALVFSNDITGAAKVISEYAAKSNEKISIVCGGYNGKLLSQAEIKILSQLPSMNELRAKIIAVIQTPAQRLAVLSQAPACQIARVLMAYAKK